MKKVLLGLSIALLAFACTPPAPKTAETEKKHHAALQDTLPKDGITLNGLTMDEANTQANAYNQDSNASSKTISFWLTKEWVNNIYDLLFNQEPTSDGIRLYFGYSKAGNTLIITSTVPSGDNEKAVSGGDHKDYFIHKDPFLLTPSAHDEVAYEAIPGAKLFDVDAGCPVNDCSISKNNHISCDTAHAYVQRYMHFTVTLNTLSEWWPKQLIANLYAELNTPAAVKNQADGVRIYVGKNSMQQDAFIFATTKTVNDPASTTPVHQDYYECYDQSLKDDFDNGEACPTNCTDVTWPRSDPGVGGYGKTPKKR